MSLKALERHLEPLLPFIETEGVTEVCINRPEEVYVEKNRVFTRHETEGLDASFLKTLAALVAEYNDKEFPAPLISGSLPNGARIQFVMNPACEKEKVVCSIRLHQARDMKLEDYAVSGAFSAISGNGSRVQENNTKLKALYEKGDIEHFIRLAIHARKNILISGGTGTGKTTFLNACLKCIAKEERLITVEDTREVSIQQPNALHLLFNEEDERIDARNIFKTCLRLRPDRIFLSELRGKEIWPYLRAANSGHPGSLSTIHADTPKGALSQLVLMMQQAGTTSREEEIRRYIQDVVHIVIQLRKSTDANQFVYVSDIYFDQLHQ